MTDAYDAVMERLNQTKPVVDRDPFIGAGQHDSLIITSVETFIDSKLGEFNKMLGFSVRATFYVEKSTLHPAGSQVVKIWNLFKPSKFPTQATDADQFAQFVCILQGLPEGQHAASVKALTVPREAGGNLEAQPARGARISCTGTEVGKPNEKTGKRYVKTTWKTYPQDGNMIAQTRAQLDQRAPYTPQPPAAQQQQPQPMNPYQQQPMMQPQPMQQYQQPMQPQFQQQPAQPQTVQGAPAGGFLSLIPQK